MMKPLRKRHLIIWRAMAVLLPAGIIIAWMAIPQPVHQPLLQPESAVSLPIVLRKAISRDYSVLIRANADTSNLQLEWTNENILQYPTATIYAENPVAKNINEMKPIGRIEARGTWHFPLDSTFKDMRKNRLFLYDFIHKQIIDTIKLLP